MSIEVYIYRINYIAPLAIIRSILLMFPLPYHNYSGTAVKCPLVYEIFYGGTLIVVLIQLAWDHDSGSRVLVDVDAGDSYTILGSDLRARRSNQQRLQLDSCELTAQVVMAIPTCRKRGSFFGCNLFSDLLHIILLWHVRSTAGNWSDRKHVLYFYTQHPNGLQQQQLLQSYPSSETNGNGLNGSGRNRSELMLDQPLRTTTRPGSGPRDLLERMKMRT
jgi:hypothetical protein